MELNLFWHVARLHPNLHFKGVEKTTAMAGPFRMISQAIRLFWFPMTGQKHSSCEPAAPAVVLHDPAARQPHDLDDAFFDPKVQTRIANVIAHTKQKKS